jgi:hypothetical protein
MSEGGAPAGDGSIQLFVKSINVKPFPFFFA